MANKIGKIRKIKQRSIANDRVYTPLEVALKLIEMTEIKETDSILDPSKGRGIFFDNLPNCREKMWCEIEDGVDFFEFHHDDIDVVIGNPPYSLWTDWLKHTISLNPRKIAYVFGMLNFTPIRLQLLYDSGYRITKIHITTVANWFANCVLAVFERNAEPIITFDTVRHKEQKGLKT